MIRAAALAALCGCAFMARGPEMYREDTAALLHARRGQIKRCYDEVLRTDPNAGGTVAVRFAVRKKTGVVEGARVVPERTTAPEHLQHCVLRALEGLRLDPPDDRTDGDATFTWEFQAAPRKG